jgi:mono/diheme cytochrome c family protein
LRQSPPSHFFDVITNGFGAMPSYADKLSADDRWRVIAYIRVLQLSQNVPQQMLSKEDRAQVERSKTR